jgi:hypothetical protein
VGVRIAVTGDRAWPGSRYNDILHPLKTLPRDTVVILGDASGVDSLALMACEALHLEYILCTANWARYGKAAGPKRNAAMLAHKPDEVWWWHPDISKSKGTKNMLAQAERKGIPTKNMMGG